MKGENKWKEIVFLYVIFKMLKMVTGFDPFLLNCYEFAHVLSCFEGKKHLLMWKTRGERDKKGSWVRVFNSSHIDLLQNSVNQKR